MKELFKEHKKGTEVDYKSYSTRFRTCYRTVYKCTHCDKYIVVWYDDLKDPKTWAYITDKLEQQLEDPFKNKLKRLHLAGGVGYGRK